MRERTSGLFTDFYELTMMQACIASDKTNDVVFDYFIRQNPFNGGYCIFAGLESLVQKIQSIHFSEDDLAFLADRGVFSEEFLQYLRDFQFSGDIYSMHEGSYCFAGEPILRIRAPLPEVQLIEGLVLNTLNFQSLIATKAFRIADAAQGTQFVELGLRRAQGEDAALMASRAAYIGGAQATSNTLAAQAFAIPAIGTMAHSWIMAFEEEVQSFETFAALYPQSSTFLIDTYASLNSGIRNAITVGKKLQENGHNFGIRIDSGDIEFLSRALRKRLDEAGCQSARIAVTNELDEHIIAYLTRLNCPIDIWGIGTKLVTGGSDPALSGVLKMASRKTTKGWKAVMKVSDDPEKASNPGIKQVYRYTDETGMYLADLICHNEEDLSLTPHIHHPSNFAKHSWITNATQHTPLLHPIMQDGRLTYAFPDLPTVRTTAQDAMHSLDSTYRRLLNPHIYKVSISDALRKTKKNLQNKRT